MEDLPVAVTTYVAKEFKMENYYNISKVETPLLTQFSINFETDTQYITLSFDMTGKLIDKKVENI